MDKINRVKESGKSVYSYYLHKHKGYSDEEAFENAIDRNSKYVYVEIDGVSYPIKEAMKVVGCQVGYSTVMKRIKFGMSPYEAITRPNQVYK